MLPLITAQLKDVTLQWLCANVRPSRYTQISKDEIMNTVNVDFDTLHAILDDFEEMGLIESLNMRRTAIQLSLKVKAHDLFRNGGFAVTDALAEANIQKLLLELESLRGQIKPDQLETYNKVAAIVSSIVAVVDTFSGNK